MCGNSSSCSGSDTQTQCSCEPGTWRGCMYSSTLNQTVDATGAPCNRCAPSTGACPASSTGPTTSASTKPFSTAPLGHERPGWCYPTGRCAYLPSVTCYRQSIKPPPPPPPTLNRRGWQPRGPPLRVRQRLLRGVRARPHALMHTHSRAHARAHTHTRIHLSLVK